MASLSTSIHRRRYSSLTTRLPCTSTQTRFAPASASTLPSKPSSSSRADHPRPFGVQPFTRYHQAGEEAEAGDRPVSQPQRQPRIPILLVLVRPHSRGAIDARLLVQQVGLSNCFLSFPLHQSALPYFIFQFEGELYQFTRLPFGLSSAPRICTMLLSVLQHELHHCGVSRLVRYLDDFLPIEHDFASAQRSLLTAQRVMTDFGLVVNPEKTEGPVPAHRLSGHPARLHATDAGVHRGKAGRAPFPSVLRLAGTLHPSH